MCGLSLGRILRLTNGTQLVRYHALDLGPSWLSPAVLHDLDAANQSGNVSTGRQAVVSFLGLDPVFDEAEKKIAVGAMNDAPGCDLWVPEGSPLIMDAWDSLCATDRGRL